MKMGATSIATSRPPRTCKLVSEANSSTTNSVPKKSLDKSDKKKQSFDKPPQKKPDSTVLHKPVETSVGTLEEAVRILTTGTDECCETLSNECKLIYECRVCQSLFRSLANFLQHKKSYCVVKFNVFLRTIGNGEVSEKTLFLYNKSKGHTLTTRRTSKRDIFDLLNKLKFDHKIEPVPSQLVVREFEESNEAVYNHFKQGGKKPSEEKSAVLGPDGKIAGLSDGRGSSICSFCDEEFTLAEELAEHIEEEHSNLKVCFECPTCKKEFSNIWAVYRHMYRVHGKSNEQVRKMRSQIVKKYVKDEPKVTSDDSNDKKNNGKFEKPSINKVWTESENICNICNRHFERRVAFLSHHTFCRKKNLNGPAVLPVPLHELLKRSATESEDEPTKKKCRIQARMYFEKSPEKTGSNSNENSACSEYPQSDVSTSSKSPTPTLPNVCSSTKSPTPPVASCSKSPTSPVCSSKSLTPPPVVATASSSKSLSPPPTASPEPLPACAPSKSPTPSPVVSPSKSPTPSAVSQSPSTRSAVSPISTPPVHSSESLLSGLPQPRVLLTKTRLPPHSTSVNMSRRDKMCNGHAKSPDLQRSPQMSPNSERQVKDVVSWYHREGETATLAPVTTQIQIDSVDDCCGLQLDSTLDIEECIGITKNMLVNSATWDSEDDYSEKEQEHNFKEEIVEISDGEEPNVEPEIQIDISTSRRSPSTSNDCEPGTTFKETFEVIQKIESNFDGNEAKEVEEKRESTSPESVVCSGFSEIVEKFEVEADEAIDTSKTDAFIRHEKKGIWECSLCFRPFTKLRGAQVHVSKHLVDFTFRCLSKNCNFAGFDESSIKRHVISFHRTTRNLRTSVTKMTATSSENSLQPTSSIPERISTPFLFDNFALNHLQPD